MNLRYYTAILGAIGGSLVGFILAIGSLAGQLPREEFATAATGAVVAYLGVAIFATAGALLAAYLAPKGAE